MGQFVSLKITAQELAEHGMTSLPGTQWKNQAEMLKAKLDEDGTFVAQRLGQILDLLELSIAATSIGADIPSVATKTVQGVLSSFEAAIASRYTKTEADTLISGNTNNLMESLTFNDQTGVFTIRKKDGTVSTIDTVLEKVPVSMTFETVGGATRIKLVNQDGSASYADVSSLVDNYAFNNSTTVAFNITGVGNKRVLEAYVRDHSITLTHLDLAAVTELQNYVASASHSATAAANSAAGASTSEANALVSKQDAAASAANAATSASNAVINATNAEASKNAAASSETAAFNSKNAAATSSTVSQSWAVGGTGTRGGEDANNAKYWSDRAAAVVGQKVATFNGRDGVVVSMAGDYTPEMVGATPAGHGTDETKHLGVLAKTSPADTDSMALVDSADGDKLKRVSWANVKAMLGQMFAPIAHKSRHSSGGADALAPADIGAASTIHTHAATAITQDVNNRFVTDAEKTAWNRPSIPIGLISLWSGATVAIPQGWKLCDGTNGTPDLRDRFVVGAGGAYAVGDRGGSASVTLTEAQMPSHGHELLTNIVYPTTHRTYVSAGSHTVTVGAYSKGAPGYEPFIANTGGNQPHETRPPYYALCYIMFKGA